MVETVAHAPVTPTVISPQEVSVNGVKISRAAIAREMQHHTAKTPAAAREAAVRALVVRELLLAEASALGLSAAAQEDADGRLETEDEALIRTLLEQEVKVPHADADACRRYYAQNRARFRTPDLFEASHILVPAALDDAVRRSAARELAATVLHRILSGDASWEEMALAHSACPSRESGGNLGQIGPGDTVPEFEAALASISPGAPHPELVETRYGFHIVRLARCIEGRDLPLDAVEATIAAHLEVTAWHIAVRQYLSLLAGRAEIHGIALDAAASPLVQ